MDYKKKYLKYKSKYTNLYKIKQLGGNDNIQIKLDDKQHIKNFLNYLTIDKIEYVFKYMINETPTYKNLSTIIKENKVNSITLNIFVGTKNTYNILIDDGEKIETYDIEYDETEGKLKEIVSVKFDLLKLIVSEQNNNKLYERLESSGITSHKNIHILITPFSYQK